MAKSNVKAGQASKLVGETIVDVKGKKSGPGKYQTDNMPAFANIQFARKLHKAMVAKNINQSQLAAAIWGTRDQMVNGRSYVTARNRDRVSIYLAAKGLPRPDSLDKMADYLGVKADELCPEVAFRRDLALTPDVSFTVIEGGSGKHKQRAQLKVNTTISASLALKIAKLIQDEQSHADADAA